MTRTLSSNAISRTPATRTTNDSLTTILRLSNDFRLSTARPRRRPAPRSHQVLIGNFQDFWRFLGGERSFDISTHGGRLLPRAGVISGGGVSTCGRFRRSLRLSYKNIILFVWRSLRRSVCFSDRRGRSLFVLV